MSNNEERIDSLEKLLVRIGYISSDFEEKGEGYVDTQLVQIHEPLAPYGRAHNLPLLDKDNFWIWREHFRLFNTFATKLDNYNQIKLQSLENITGYYHLHSVVDKKLYPHASEDNDGMLAFTPNEEWGKQDRQLKMKFGKFFRKYYEGDISDQQLKGLANAFVGTYGKLELLWAEGTDIADVYDYRHVGFGSCMSGEHDFLYDNPALVYDSPDIKLAWLGNKENQEVRARALINVEKKEFSVVYGNEQLYALLKNEGYTDGDLDGCRIKKIPIGYKHDSKYIMPYIDRVDNFADYDDDYFIIGGGDWMANSTEGYMSVVPQIYCPACDEFHDEAFMEEVHGGDLICEGCIDYSYRWAEIDNTGPMGYIQEEVACFSEREGVYFHCDLVDERYVYSAYEDDFILLDEAVWSDTMQSHLHEDSAVKVEILKADSEDYVPEGYDIDDDEMRVA